MSQALISLTHRFARRRAGTAASRAERANALAIGRLNLRLREMRANPELLAGSRAHSLFDRVIAAIRNRRVRRRWQRELQLLDDRVLRDVGISRIDAKNASRLPRYWI